jgi:hypothetical protein
LWEGVETVKMGSNALITGLHLKGVGLEGKLTSAAICNFENLKVSVFFVFYLFDLLTASALLYNV